MSRNSETTAAPTTKSVTAKIASTGRSVARAFLLR
jgi:hypothetical protein